MRGLPYFEATLLLWAKMKLDQNPIPEMVRVTGLPSEVWPKNKISLDIKLGINYSIRDHSTRYVSPHWNGVAIPTTIIETLRDLPAAQTLGLATLIRLPSQVTVMVSIAEAANATMEESYCQLLWTLMCTIERMLRNLDKNGEVGAYYFHWQREISFEEHIRRKRQEYRGLEELEYRSLDDRGYRKSNDQGYRKSDDDSRLPLELKELRLEQSHIRHELQTIQQQNQEILQLLRKISSRSQYESHSLGKQAEQSDIAPIETTQTLSEKYYKDCSSTLYLKRLQEQWIFCVDPLLPEAEAFTFLLDWLAINLGGTVRRAWPVGLHCISVDTENRSSLSSGESAKSSPLSNNCWRNKIRRGNIFSATSISRASEYSSREETLLPYPYMSGSLTLTAAALWTLFDNALKRAPGCHCTFQAASKEYLQCRSKQGKWLIWHLSNDENICGGRFCTQNVKIALTKDESGEMLFTTSPCILGWFATSRDNPQSKIWTVLGVSSEFKRKPFETYKVKKFQALAQLSVPLIISPQIGGAITFSKRNYEVANSIDPHSKLALESVATTTVLVFDERRQIHLTLDGADIIEMCCLQHLRTVGYDPAGLPPFSHYTALQRLATWSASTFPCPTGSSITGDHLVREITNCISALIDQNKLAVKDSEFLYWPLEDTLQGVPSKALKAPRCQHNSWHRLAFKAVPLILIVGEIDSCLLSETGTDFTLSESNAGSASRPRGLFGRFQHNVVHGGVVGSRETVKRWMLQGQLFDSISLRLSDSQLSHGELSEHAYEIVEGSSVNGVGFNCSCKGDISKSCLHYIL